MEIPDYPASRPIRLEDKPLLDKIFNRLQPKISEFCFAGLYLFRAIHDYHLTNVSGALVLLGRGYDNKRYFMPPLTGEPAVVLKRLFADRLQLYGADESFAELFLQQEDVVFVEDRDSFDYLYLREELANLRGNHFHKKKNRVNYFTSRHTYEVALYTAAHCAESLKLLEDWHSAATHPASASLLAEIEANREALLKAEELALEGVVVVVEGRVRALALGERLNQDTMVCHFEKADPFMEGLAQLVNREFASQICSGCSYINREQDLGDIGLRTAKLSYHPVELVKKYRAGRMK